MRLKNALTAGLLGLGISGCTFFNEGDPRLLVHLKMPEGLPAGATGSERRITVQIPFEDRRPDRHHCGSQKKTYGFTPGFVICATPPEAELARLLADRLRAEGYDVATDGGPVAPTTLKIEGQLMQFYVEPVRGVADTETDIHVHLRASSGSGLEASRDFFVKGRGSDFQRSVNSSLRKILTAMVDAITRLLDGQPGLGQPARNPLEHPDS